MQPDSRYDLLSEIPLATGHGLCEQSGEALRMAVAPLVVTEDQCIVPSELESYSPAFAAPGPEDRSGGFVQVDSIKISKGSMGYEAQGGLSRYVDCGWRRGRRLRCQFRKRKR